MPAQGDFYFLVELSEKQIRLDTLVAIRVAALSRSHAALLIRDGHITVDGMRQKTGYRVKPGESIRGCIPPPAVTELKASPLPLHVLYEDADLIVIDKPAGMVVHPAAGHTTDTLVNALLHRCPDLGGIGGELRPGIVHRLDKDTSGVLVVAKNDQAQENLSCQFKDRVVEKTYLAVVRGAVRQGSGKIDLPIGRHPADRKKMSTITRKGRPALTLWQVKEVFRGASLLEIKLRTGRTHQIRVHCAAMGHPVLGDQVYGRLKTVQQLAKADPDFFRTLTAVKRQMLHAARLGFAHPTTGQFLTFEAPMPRDMTDFVNALR